jgi:hypothetical protein
VPRLTIPPGAIENTLHWCLDVTFREDESRLRDRHAANNLAWLKRFALSLLKQIDDKESIAMRRRMAGWNPAALDHRQAEVGDPELPAGVEHEVRGLDIPVDHARLVGVFQRLGRLQAQLSRGAEQGRSLLGRLGRNRGERLTLGVSGL